MITPDTLIGDILDKGGKYEEILSSAGMHCLGCPASRGETLGEACEVHGVDADELVRRLNG